jgi:multimeric flavodoxin WrbA
MVKIVCILGSPRHDGNSNTVANRFLETAKKLGAEVITYELDRLNFRDCQACCACKISSEECVLKDDISEAIKSIVNKTADIYLVASPIWGGGIPGQLQCFFDRGYCFTKGGPVKDIKELASRSRVVSGKKGVLVISQGAPENEFGEVAEKYKMRMERMWRLDDVRVLRVCGVGAQNRGVVAPGIPKDVRPEQLKQAEDLAREMMANS